MFEIWLNGRNWSDNPILRFAQELIEQVYIKSWSEGSLTVGDYLKEIKLKRVVYMRIHGINWIKIHLIKVNL